MQNPMLELKDFGIHDLNPSRWKRKPADILREYKIPYETYIFKSAQETGSLYVYVTDVLTNALIYNELGVTDDCPIDEIEIPR